MQESGFWASFQARLKGKGRADNSQLSNDSGAALDKKEDEATIFFSNITEMGGNTRDELINMCHNVQDYLVSRPEVDAARIGTYGHR